MDWKYKILNKLIFQNFKLVVDNLLLYFINKWDKFNLIFLFLFNK